jgi:SAM-dependent methyltransferase
MRTSLRLYLSSLPANLRYLDKYVRGGQMLADCGAEKQKLFDEFMAFSRENGRKCLQIGARGKKIGPNWVSVDLYDKSPIIDYHYDLRSLGFPDGSFDACVCNAILEHVDDPPKAISELHRVLKPGGRVWVEVPLNQPYHPSPNDYWRVTPEGLRKWMSSFREIKAGGCFINRSVIYTASFFYGEKV